MSKRSWTNSRRRYALAASAATVVAGVAAVAVVPLTASAATTRPVPGLHWRPCDGQFQCATARVPLDYRHPHGRTISLALIRHPATDGARRAQTLFINFGGPSEQIGQFTADFGAIPAALRARFDLVTFDPRGIGFSTGLRCFPTMAAENRLIGALPPFPVGAAEVRTWERAYATFDQRCARNGGALIDHDTTEDVARDLDRLRQAVGAARLNYLGLSYGTGLGAVYANLFPSKVGHFVLDGNLDPVAWTRASALPSSLRRGEDLAAAATMNDFLDLCGQAGQARCAFSAGSPAATRAKWQTLLRRLRAHPVKFGSPPQVVTYADLVTAVPLGVVSQWQATAQLGQLLWLAAQPGDAAGRLAPPATAPYAGLEQSYAMICADTADPHGSGAYAAAARLARARAGGLGLYFAWSEEVCAGWPRAAGADRYAGPWNRRTASPILVIGNTGDPATPYHDAVAMTRDLARARLLTVKGYGHTEFFNPSTCAARDEVRYLTRGILPRPGSVCRQNGTPFPAS
jgi:pimeloyl-ACP methyl ester carboxylesterase